MAMLLVVGAGRGQIPAMKVAHELGHRVFATDVNPDAPGFKVANDHAVVSIDDPEGTVAAAREHGIDGVITMGTDFGVRSVAAVADELDLPGLDPTTARVATHKGAMMETLADHGTPVPSFRTVTSADESRVFADSHDGPWVVKPTDSAGQRGISVVKRSQDLSDAVAAATSFASDDSALIQQFVPGPEINVTAIVRDGEIHLLSLSNRITADPPHFGIALQHVSPPDINDEDQMAVRRVAESAIEAVGIENGIAYPQIVVGPQGPRLIEIAARIPGGQMREVAMYRSGVDQLRAAIYHALGEPFTLEDVSVVEPSPAVAVRFFTELDIDGLETFGRARNIEEARSLPGVKAVEIYLDEGEDIPRLSDATGRFGYVVAVGEDRTTAIRTAERAGSIVAFE